MEETTFDEVFRWMCKFHGKDQLLNVNQQVRAEWWRLFYSEHDDVFCEAGALATNITEAREIVWQRIKDKEPKKPLSEPKFPRDNRNTERGRRWLAGILEITEGKRTVDDVIAEMNGPRITTRDQEN